MSNPTWTRERPIVAGWYWYKEGKEIAVLTFVSRGLEMAFSMPLTINARHSYPNWSVRTLAYMVGEWLGPIPPDSYQQGRVACLGDVKRYVERQIKIGEDFIGGPDPNIQRRVALDEVIEYCDRQLAQQAQEEKGVGDGKV